jgi:hypothetical protein
MNQQMTVYESFDARYRPDEPLNFARIDNADGLTSVLSQSPKDFPDVGRFSRSPAQRRSIRGFVNGITISGMSRRLPWKILIITCSSGIESESAFLPTTNLYRIIANKKTSTVFVYSSLTISGAVYSSMSTSFLRQSARSKAVDAREGSLVQEDVARLHGLVQTAL